MSCDWLNAASPDDARYAGKEDALKARWNNWCDIQ